jgi:uncharacterized membrane protein
MIFVAVDAASAATKTVTFCNKTTQPIDLAWGYDAAGTSETTSAGWKQLGACACNQLFHADVRATEFWLLVLKSGTFEQLTNGQGPLCVHPSKGFKFINENNSANSCHAAGGKWLNFAQQNANLPNHTVNFRVPGGPSCNL